MCIGTVQSRPLGFRFRVYRCTVPINPESETLRARVTYIYMCVCIYICVYVCVYVYMCVSILLFLRFYSLGLRVSDSGFIGTINHYPLHPINIDICVYILGSRFYIFRCRVQG